jgi:hypothetical protein
LENARTFALLPGEVFDVERYGCSQPKWAINQAIELYFKIRSPRVQRIIERGQKLVESKGSVGIVKEYVMYLLLWLLIKFPSLSESKSFSPYSVRTDFGYAKPGLVTMTASSTAGQQNSKFKKH